MSEQRREREPDFHRDTHGDAAREALGIDPERDEQLRRETGSQPAGGISELPDRDEEVSRDPTD